MSTEFADTYKEVMFPVTIGPEYEYYAELPPELQVDKIQPFPTQLKTLHRMKYIEAHCKLVSKPQEVERANEIMEFESRVGVLANKPGAGKSLVVLALCCSPCSTQNELTITKSNAFSSTTYRFREYGISVIESLECNLIVVPPKLLLQWTEYVNCYFQEMPFVAINHSKQIPKTMEEFRELIGESRILFVSATFIGPMSRILSRFRFDRIFFDEIDSLDFPHAGNIDIHTNFLWFVTATPGKFFNVVGRALSRAKGSDLPWNFREYLRSRTEFRGLYRELLSHFVVRCSDEEVDSDLNLPPYILTTVTVPSSAAVRLTDGLLTEEANWLIHGDRIRQAIMLLCGESEEDAQPDAAPRHTLAEAVTMHLDKSILEVEEKIQFLNDQLPTSPAMAEQKRIQTEKYMSRVRDLQRQKEMLVERVDSAKECLICLEDEMTNPVGLKCCNRGFCRMCIKNWLKEKANCPNCRTKIKGVEDLVLPSKKRKCEDDEAVEASPAVEAPPPARPRTKMSAVLEIVKESNKSVVYLTSDADASAYLVMRDLTQEGIKVLSLSRLSSVGCQRVIAEFKESAEKTCLVVSSVHNSAGFNLPFVDSIIMYQRMPQDEMQIIGRGMRPGRTQPLKVFRIEYDSPN